MCKTLEETRKNIDKIDNEIVKLIAERTKYVKKAAEFKKDDNDVKAPDRVKKVISNHINFKAKKLFGKSGEIIDGTIAYIEKNGGGPFTKYFYKCNN